MGTIFFYDDANLDSDLDSNLGLDVDFSVFEGEV